MIFIASVHSIATNVHERADFFCIGNCRSNNFIALIQLIWQAVSSSCESKFKFCVCELSMNERKPISNRTQPANKSHKELLIEYHRN